MIDIKCRKKDCEETTVQLHHLIPRSIGGIDTDGRKYLCKKHHDIIPQMIIPILFSFIPEEKKDLAKQKVKEYTLKWMNQ